MELRKNSATVYPKMTGVRDTWKSLMRDMVMDTLCSPDTGPNSCPFVVILLLVPL
jgi:hypothetical protein